MYEKMRREVETFGARIRSEKLRKMFLDCFFNTIDHAVRYETDGGAYIVTGDIPAMWLRDSSASVIQYVPFSSSDKDVQALFKGLFGKQRFFISVDPYSNSFNFWPNGDGHREDEGLRTPYTWERKFEIDSLCYPISILFDYYTATKDKSVLGDHFKRAMETILDTFETETDHFGKSEYFHYRPGEKKEFCIPNHGHGSPVKVTGLIWSGYRPSDDAQKYGYFIPGNMFAVVSLRKMATLLRVAEKDDLAKRAEDLADKVDKAIEEYGTVEMDGFGKVYAFETDGLGNYLLMDDANVPSLLSIPYIGYRGVDDQIYKNTRKFILSKANPYYFSGKCLTGIGSPHTPKGYVWHIALTMQGLTSTDEQEKVRMLEMIMDSDDGTYLTHEGVNKDDPHDFSRAWFAWSNSLFATYVFQNIALFHDKGEE